MRRAHGRAPDVCVTDCITADIGELGWAGHLVEVFSIVPSPRQTCRPRLTLAFTDVQNGEYNMQRAPSIAFFLLKVSVLIFI